MVTQAASPTDWSYAGDSGPAHWGELSPSFVLCSRGQHQSPIEIRQFTPRRMPALSMQYRSTPLQITHDGHTVRVTYPRGSFLKIGTQRYELMEFLFHTPGEHVVNGRRGEMEIQLLHRDGAGKLGILAIPVVAGRRFNAMLQRLGEYLPAQPGESHYYRRVGIKPSFLLPSDRSYFRYEGSLTTPPCSEGVTWFVMGSPLEASPQQLAAFQSLLGNNARPIQDLHNRAVWADPR